MLTALKMAEVFRILTTFVKTLNICGIKYLRFNEYDILAYFNSGGHDIRWLQIVQKILFKFVPFCLFLFYYMVHVSFIRIALSRRF